METIILAATPIGNCKDASVRLCEVLAEADIIAAEDTRKLFDLVRRINISIKSQVITLHEHNEQDVAVFLVEQAETGKKIVVVSDAGMPTISDPGYRLVQHAIVKNVPISVVPGPSAVLTALAMSGLATDRFAFEGFIPRKEGEKRRKLESLASDERTLVFFESPRRLLDTLEIMSQVLGSGRNAAVCREITKTFEEVKRGTLQSLCKWAQEEVIGEIVLVVAGAKPARKSPEDYADMVLELAQEGLRLKDAAKQVAQATNISPRELFEVAIRAKTKSDSK